MLSVDGDADAAVTTKICSGWFMFRSLASFLTAKDVSLLLQGKAYDICMELYATPEWDVVTEKR